MYAARQWSVRHARGLEALYKILEPVMVVLHPLWRCVGYGRLERPVRAVERTVKGFLFDCRMCGQCVLNSTGMSCPMNCPKRLLNGPCGGVRNDGSCEVDRHMRCVWVAAAEGRARMRSPEDPVQRPLDTSLLGASSWLRVVCERTAAPRGADAGR